MSTVDKKNLDLSAIFPAKNWVDQEHLLLTGEPIQITRAKKLGFAILEAMTGPIAAVPLAFISSALLGLFNYSEAQAMSSTNLPDQHSPRFENMDDFAHNLQISEAQQLQETSCPVNIFWIQGASPPTESPVYYPSTIPCDLDYSGEKPTLTFTGLDFAQYGIGPDQNAVLITPIAALTENGEIPFLVDVHIGGDKTDAASMLCPSDMLSNLMLGNPIQGNQFTNGPEATMDCYEASEAFIEATAFDSQGQAHPFNMTINPDGNMFIFANTTFSQSGILQIEVGRDTQWPNFIQSSLMRGLRQNFGNDVVILFAPNGVDPVADRFPILTEKTPEPPITIATETANLINTTTQNAEVIETIEKNEAPLRQVFGQNLSVQLTCLDGECPEVYGIVDESLPAFQNLMQLYSSGNIIDDKQAGNLVGEIISSSKEPKIINWVRNIFGKETVPLAVKKFSSDGVNLNLTNVLYISQNQNMTTILATLELDGKTLYFVINSKSKLLSDFTFQLSDQANNSDAAGLQVFDNIQQDVTKADSPSYLRDWDQDLFITRPELVSGLDSGRNILYIAEAYRNETVAGYQITEEGLTPTTINLATVGKYAGNLYKDPKDGRLYVSLSVTDEASYQTKVFLVPMEYVDTSK